MWAHSVWRWVRKESSLTVLSTPLKQMFVSQRPFESLALTNQSQARQTYRGDSRENNSAAWMMFRCGHGLLNQQGTIKIQMLGYILMVTVCAGTGRKVEMQAIFWAIVKGDGTSRSQLCQDEQNKLADAHLILAKAWLNHWKYMTWTSFLNVHSKFSTSSLWSHCSGEGWSSPAPRRCLKADSHMASCRALVGCVTVYGVRHQTSTHDHTPNICTIYHVVPLPGISRRGHLFLGGTWSVLEAQKSNATILPPSPQTQPLVVKFHFDFWLERDWSQSKPVNLTATTVGMHTTLIHKAADFARRDFLSSCGLPNWVPRITLPGSKIAE